MATGLPAATPVFIAPSAINTWATAIFNSETDCEMQVFRALASSQPRDAVKPRFLSQSAFKPNHFLHLKL
jgi:hypothetical protein